MFDLSPNLRRASIFLALTVSMAVCWLGPVGAIVPPEDPGAENALSEGFAHPMLEVQPSLETFDREAKALQFRPEMASFLATIGQVEIRWDARSDRPHLVEGEGIPLLPGKGNRLRAEDLGLKAGETPSLAEVETLVRAFLAEHDVLRTESLDFRLDENASLLYEGYLWLVELQQVYEGVPVRGANVFFRVNHGNIVQFGANRVAEIALDTTPRIDARAALGRALGAVGLPRDLAAVVAAGRLEIVPVMGEDEAPGQAYFGAPGVGYSHRLTWFYQVQPTVDGGLWSLRVDAHTGELLEAIDETRYATVRGQVFPTTNTDPLTSVTFPFTKVTNGTTKYTSASGSYTYTTGTTATARLDGRYIRINDSCGSIALSNSTNGNLDFSGATGTNCTTPGLGGAGNTNAARTGYYHLTNINRKAASFYPSNSWLNGTVTANMNINSTCNAFWNGSTVNFYRSGGGCSNTGEIAAVFLHEWGHGMDTNDGGGSTSDKGTGEAYADTFAFLETETACIGHNFRPGVPCTNCRSSCTGVRDLAAFAQGGVSTIARPSNVASNTGINCDAWSCPYSYFGTPYRGPMGYEGHCESYIASTANWDLTQSLRTAFGANDGWELMDKIWYGALPAIDSAYQVTSGGQCNPSATVNGCGAENWYTVFRAVDDDDGNLANGTPNACRIWDAFNAHGIACGSRPACTVTREVDGNGFQEYLLFDDDELVLDDGPTAYCALAGYRSNTSTGYCYVNHDGDDDTWELFARNGATCNFVCIPRSETCSSLGRKEVLQVSGEIVYNDNLYDYCAIGGGIPNSSTGYCAVNHDGDDDTWELFASNATCNHMCIPSGCAQIGSKHEVYLGPNTTYTLPDSTYQLCATGTVRGTGNCWADHDGAGNWRMTTENAYCNFICLRR